MHFRQAGINTTTTGDCGHESFTTTTTNSTSSSTASTPTTRNAEFLLLDAAVAKSEALLKDYGSLFHSISPSTIEHGLSKARDILPPHFRQLLKRQYHMKRDQMRAALDNLAKRLEEETRAGYVGGGGGGGGAGRGGSEALRGDIEECRKYGLTAENEIVLNAELLLVKYLTSRQQRRQQGQRQRQFSRDTRQSQPTQRRRQQEGNAGQHNDSDAEDCGSSTKREQSDNATMVMLENK